MAGCAGGRSELATSTPAHLTDGSGSAYYANNMECRWTLAAAANQPIVLVFEGFSLESATPGSGTCLDWVRVYDGMTTAAPVLGTFCGSRLPPALASTGPAMLVEFRTNDQIISQGFHARYAVGA